MTVEEMKVSVLVMLSYTLIFPLAHFTLTSALCGLNLLFNNNSGIQ